jgi:hypothetical protein
MTTSKTTRALALLCASLASPLTWAHEGHGIEGLSHWHGTDAWGFVFAGVVAMAMWFGSRK